MSKRAEYDCFSKVYDNEMAAAGSDVMCALMQFYTGTPLKNLHVLDAGCGTGNYGKTLIDYGVGKVTLLDASQGMLEVAKEKLADEIETGKVAGIVQHIMPPIPFPDSSFDAVMFNLVLNHLDRLCDDEFPTCVQTLKEARRVLRPGGVIYISTILKSNAQNMWSTYLDKSLGDRVVQSLQSLHQLEAIFYKAGLTCILKMNILDSRAFPNYFTDPEAYINNFLHYVRATDAESSRVHQVLKELNLKGRLQQWIAEHDKVNTTGLFTQIVCKAKP